MTEVVLKYPNLLEYGAAILLSTNQDEKVQLTHEAYNLYKQGKLPVRTELPVPQLPDICGRPETNTVLPSETSTKVKGDTRLTRLKLIHSQAHIESYAIDLSWDILVRFANTQHAASSSSSSSTTTTGPNLDLPEGTHLPDEFFADWLQVAEDEARHFSLWADRLKELDSYYGAFPTHDSLWESALDTKDSVLARLAIVHCIHEAHGLDVAGRMLNLFRGQNDKKSLEHLELINKEEIDHVAAGVKWFKYICEQSNMDVVPKFHQVVCDNWRGKIKPPFNHELRALTGMTREWYEPLVELTAQREAEKKKELEEKEGKKRIDVHAIMAERKKKKDAEAAAAAAAGGATAEPETETKTEA